MIECCICETNEHSAEYGVVDGYKLLKCSKCGLVFIEEKADTPDFMDDAKKELDSENKKVEYWSFPEMYEKYRYIFTRYFEERMERCQGYNGEIKSLFDVGSGYGFWMDFCRKKGLVVKGIDISEEAVNYCREVLDLEVMERALRDYEFTDQYDLYNMCDVVEHLENPNNELAMLHKKMKASSLLFIQVPDVLGMKIPYNHNLGLPHHIWQFNSGTMTKLLMKNGFKVLNRWHGVQGVIGCYENNSVNMMKKIQWFIAEKCNLGNRLMLLCKKSS